MSSVLSMINPLPLSWVSGMLQMNLIFTIIFTKISEMGSYGEKLGLQTEIKNFSQKISPSDIYQPQTPG